MDELDRLVNSVWSRSPARQQRHEDGCARGFGTALSWMILKAVRWAEASFLREHKKWCHTAAVCDMT
jgi:hypothetical protein